MIYLNYSILSTNNNNVSIQSEQDLYHCLLPHPHHLRSNPHSMYISRHIDGAELIGTGTYLENEFKNHQLYVNTLSTAAYVIVFGSYIILAIFAQRFFLSRRLGDKG